jgi:hypothetical protein
MERHVRHTWVGVEDLLRAIAVVRVVVDDQDALAAVGERGGGDGHVVEQAETHRTLGAGVVARRSQRQERGVVPLGRERVGGGEPGARRPHRRVPRAG